MSACGPEVFGEIPATRTFDFKREEENRVLLDYASLMPDLPIRFPGEGPHPQPQTDILRAPSQSKESEVGFPGCAPSPQLPLPPRLP